MKQKFRAAWEKVKNAYRILVAHKYTTVAGTLVFFLVISVVPFFFWLTLLFGSLPAAGVELADLEIFGWAKETLVFLRDSAAEASKGAGIFLLATTLWSATGFFYHLRRSGEILYGCDRHRGWKVRLSALAVTLAVLIFFAAAGLLIFAGVVGVRFLPAWVGYPALFLLLAVLGFFAAWILNAYVCPYRVRPSDTVWGSALTAALWLAAAAVFSVYLKFSSAEKLYGALSVVIAALLFLYWMMTCLTAGIIYNRHRLGNRKPSARTF